MASWRALLLPCSQGAQSLLPGLCQGHRSGGLLSAGPSAGFPWLTDQTGTQFCAPDTLLCCFPWCGQYLRDPPLFLHLPLKLTWIVCYAPGADYTAAREAGTQTTCQFGDYRGGAGTPPAQAGLSPEKGCMGSLAVSHCRASAVQLSSGLGAPPELALAHVLACGLLPTCFPSLQCARHRLHIHGPAVLCSEVAHPHLASVLPGPPRPTPGSSVLGNLFNPCCTGDPCLTSHSIRGFFPITGLISLG